MADDEVSGTDASTQSVGIDSATIVLGTLLDDFGGLLNFSSGDDAQAAWSLFEDKALQDNVWGKSVGDGIALAQGSDDWIQAFRSAYESDQMTALNEFDEFSWNLITNLPEDPTSRPIAAGAMTLSTGLLETLGGKAGISLDGIGNAFGFVRVDTVGFGVYSDRQISVAARIDERYLIESDASVLFVSQSSYPGGLVAFLLSVVGGRSGMELIDLGDTNARHRQIENLHVVIKNKGSLVFASVASSQEAAEDLLLSALAD